MSTWEIEHDRTNVVCPDCAFSFDAIHQDGDGGYTCPLCEPAPESGEPSGAEAVVREAKATLSDAEVARIIEAVEAHCGMGRGAWDMVAARDLVEGFAAALGADTRRIDASETLLPCPFCGGEAVRITTRYSENCDTVKANGGQTLFHGVKCIVCGARTSTVVGYRTPGEADVAWNRRTEAATVNGEEEERAEAVAAMARKALDAQVRGLVEENERLRRELREIAGWCESHGHPESRAPNATTETQRNWAFTVIAEMGKRARNALATPTEREGGQDGR